MYLTSNKKLLQTCIEKQINYCPDLWVGMWKTLQMKKLALPATTLNDHKRKPSFYLSKLVFNSHFLTCCLPLDKTAIFCKRVNWLFCRVEARATQYLSNGTQFSWQSWIGIKAEEFAVLHLVPELSRGGQLISTGGPMKNLKCVEGRTNNTSNNLILLKIIFFLCTT